MRQSPRSSVIGAFLFGALLMWHRPFRHGLLTVVRFPFVVVSAGIKMVVLVPRLPSLAHGATRLQEQLAQAQVDNSQLREQLRALIQTQRLTALVVPAGQRVVAHIIGRSPLPTQQMVLVDRGSRDGLSLESILVNAAGVIGRVSDLHLTTATALLLTDPDSRIAALIERSRETGLLMGRGRGQCELIYLDPEADIQAGDRVVTAGLSGTFPKGLPLGTVTRVIVDQRSGAVSAWVIPAVRMGQLEDILVLTHTSE